MKTSDGKEDITPTTATSGGGVDQPHNQGVPRAWGIFLFAMIGATATIAAVSQLRRSFDWFCTQLNRSHPSWKTGDSGSTHWTFREEAWKRYNRRMQEEIEQELERVERIRRMQEIFNRERNKYKRSYEGWRVYGPAAYQHHQDAQQSDWHWKTDTSYRDQRANGQNTSRDSGGYSMSHHYSVLGLDRSRIKPYTDAEIKTAFRSKAMEFHPDQNQKNKEVAEARFKEVMKSYEAIKLERNKRMV